ncbi:MAG: hypothetical protein H7X99_10110 [Saprospiraceae bacterium]|nr:hypothetical protein [Saprospiraceae bacterium]
MSKYITLLLLLVNSIASFGQFKPEDFKAMKFRNIGPAGMSGRITAIDVDLSNPHRIYAGAASGGVWLSENGGTSWTPIFDEQSSLAIGSIKINQKNPSEIWVGTGEGNPRNSLNTGNGIYKTLDGGKTWQRMGLENTRTIHRIIIHRDNPDIVFASSLGSPWGATEDRGVFRTTDGGKNWKKILFVNNLTGAADLITDPTNPNKLLVAMWEHKREPWFFKSGGKGSGLYISFDAGDNFKKLSSEDGLPKGELGRIGLAVSPGKPNIIYALIEAKENGLYKTTDGGKKWTLVSTKNIGDRPFYYSELYVDPKNENRIYNIFTYITMSEDGGKTFRNIADYGNDVHPDHHAFWIHPEDTDYLIDGNDGGLNISRDGGVNWYFAGNIPVGQFYHVNVDNDFPYNVYGGMQDNGSWIGPSAVLKRGGIRNHDFQELYFGDGFDVVPFRADTRYGYAMSQGGNVGFYDRQTGQTRFIQPNHPDHEIKLRYNWNAAIAQDPFEDCGVYFGSQFLHYSDDCGESWIIMSPDLTSNDTTKQKADRSGGLTMDATNAENHTTIIAIAPSPVNKNIVWVGTDDGNVQLTRDDGKTWTNHNSFKGLPEGSWIPQIHVSHMNEGEAWVVANNYRRNDYTAYTYHTTDFGKNWERIAGDDQIKGFVLSIVQDHKESNLLFLGTDIGLYVSFDKGKKWHHWNKGFPQVQVNDMKIHPEEDDLVLGTFGRAFWILDDINPLREIAAKGEKILSNDFELMNTTNAYLVSYRSYDGVRFSGQGEFKGDNKSFDKIALNVWKKPKEKSKEEIPVTKEDTDKKEGDDKEVKDKEPKAKITISDEDGKVIRNIKSKVEDGLNKLIWGLETDGIRYPSRNEPKEDDDLPGGYNVLPGKYKVVIVLDGKKDSTIVEVKMDPRSKMTLNDLKAIKKMQDEHAMMVKEARTAFDRITEAKKSIGIVDKLLENQPDSTKKEFKKLHKNLKSSLDSLTALFMEPENVKGIQRNPDQLNSILSEALNYIRSSWTAPKENAMVAFNLAKLKTQKTVKAVDTFISNDWEKYKGKVKVMEVKIFKE